MWKSPYLAHNKTSVSVHAFIITLFSPSYNLHKTSHFASAFCQRNASISDQQRGGPSPQRGHLYLWLTPTWFYAGHWIKSFPKQFEQHTKALSGSLFTVLAFAPYCPIMRQSNTHKWMYLSELIGSGLYWEIFENNGGYVKLCVFIWKTHLQLILMAETVEMNGHQYWLWR